MSTKKTYDVGGILYERPFKIRRLNHFGISVHDTGAALRFYRDLLGFKVSDVIDTAVTDPGPWHEGLPDTNVYFLRHNADHHTFVLMPRPWIEHMEAPARADITVNQITWQVSTLREVVEARLWLQEQGKKIDRYGRDPGSNWHTYFPDPTGHTNELEYGIEQVGWDGRSKPKELWPWIQEHPALPTDAESTELHKAIAEGVDLTSGYRWLDETEKTFDVGGVMLGRPLVPVRLGPVSMFVEDLDASERFYVETLGMTRSEETVVAGHRAVFLRVNTEHHSVVLLPIEARASLGLNDETTLLAFGVQLGSYAQLRDARAYLESHGVKLIDLPRELHLGVDYVVHAVDPAGHVIQLYYSMEQVGWDGRVRTEDERRTVTTGIWPETLEPLSDTYAGETFWGPIG